MTDSFDITKLVRKNILEMKPYSSARDEYSGSASVFLDANENPFNAPLNRYPDPRQADLKQRIAQLKGLSMDQIFLGNGSDEGIDVLFRVLCEPGKDNVITVDPTYGMYSVCASINDVEQRSVLLNKDFSLDSEAVLAAVDEDTRLIFLCSPNNPTSNSLEREAMLKIIDQVNCIVVVDEAYIDFSQGAGLLSLLQEKKNLVLLQTLSKAWGFAGIRLGMLFAHPELVEYLSRVKYPYNINSLTIDAALSGLKNTEQSSIWIREILEERSKLALELESLPFINIVHPSDANFLLIRVDDPSAVYAYLMDKGIIVRDRSSVPLCEGCLRITIGTSEENRALINALKT
ncbi:MAG: histidinol-phosphate transaminase, partial [Bacteroidota bacterium]|nr:histidinol-phosphate transaminase [Bacteroidota bacterium]